MLCLSMDKIGRIVMVIVIVISWSVYVLLLISIRSSSS